LERLLVLSVWAATTEYYRLSGFNKYLFLKVLEAASPRPGHHHDPDLDKSLLAGLQAILVYPHVHGRGRERVCERERWREREGSCYMGH
jgi:hypothetical protein